jgi:hypothetical protein
VDPPGQRQGGGNAPDHPRSALPSCFRLR